MGINRHVRKIAREWFDLPSEVTNEDPRMEMMGKSRLDIENHQGLTFFRSEELKLRTNKGWVHILGKNLKIEMINPYMVTVSGEIEKVEYGK